MPRAGSRGWQSRAVPVCHRPAPLATRAAFPGVSVPSLPTWARVGVWDRQTENFQLPKAKPSWSLALAWSPGTSLEPPLSSPSEEQLGWSVPGWEGAAWPWSRG